jgi:phosphatidylglycerophosphatase A
MIQLQYFLATGFFSGYSPIAPGTVGSLLVLILFFLFPSFPIISHFLLILLLIIVGVWSSSKVASDKGKDPSIVVIDEMAGMLIALFVLPKTFFIFFLAFILFRFFDITKPFPIKAVEKLPGGWGIMMDDVVAGLYSLLLMYLLILLKVI